MVYGERDIRIDPVGRSLLHISREGIIHVICYSELKIPKIDRVNLDVETLLTVEFTSGMTCLAVVIIFCIITYSLQ